MGRSHWAVCLALLLVMSVGPFCGLSASAGGLATAFKAPVPPMIDGDLSDWNRSEVVVIGSKDQVIMNEFGWDGPDDCSADLYVAWDEDNLYIAGTIYDDVPFVSFVGFDLDGNDALGLYLSTDPAADPARSLYASTDFRVLLLLDNYYFDTAIDRRMVLFKNGIETKGISGSESVLSGYEVAVRQSEVGFDLELKIPFANFSNDSIPLLVPRAGMEVGFNLELYDLDMPCPGDVPAWLAWQGSASVRSPRDWGTLRFVEAE